jgi:hypothetical protein
MYRIPVQEGADMSDRDTEKVIMAVQKATLLMDPFFKLTAVGSALLITYLARMVKERKIKKNDFKNFQEFIKATDGKFSIVNVPVTEKSMDVDVVSDLEKLGIRYDVMPDLNMEDGFLQIAIYDEDKEKFSGWYERYLMKNMVGGEKELQDLKNLTNGKTTIMSIPAEGKEESIAQDFETLGINYSVLPDLNIGDGEIQLVVASNDLDKVKYWYGLYQSEQLAHGNEVKDMKFVSMEAYRQTGNMTAEDYIDTASPDLVNANEKYEGREAGEVEKSVMRQENRIRSMGDVAYEQYHNNPNFQEITINKATLIEKSTYAQAESIKEAGLFASRIPGTYGETEQTLLLPQEQVFLTDDGKTYIGFIEKEDKPVVMGPTGKPISVTERRNGEQLFREHYDRVEREFYKKEQLTHNVVKEMEPIKSMAADKIPHVPIKAK